MTTRKKVALVTQDLVVGGGVKTVALFYLNFFRSHLNYDVIVISLAVNRFDRYSKHFINPLTWLKETTDTEDDEFFSYHHVGATFSEFEFMRYMPRKNIRKLLKECVFVQVVSGNPAWSLSCLFAGIPIYLQVATLAHIERRMQNLNWTDTNGLIRKLFTRITRMLDYAGTRNADTIIVENLWMKSYCEEINDNVHLIPPGIDTDKFKPSLVSGKNYILTVARLDDPRKKLDLLITSYELLYSSLGDLTPNLTLAGHALDPSKILERINKSNISHKITYIQKPTDSELIILYQDAHCFVLCSDEEGFGMVIIEAMACGLPVISTRSGGPDTIIDSGHDGYLVDLNSESDIANCIAKVVTDEGIYTKFRLNGLKKIKEQYSIKRIYDQLGSIYK